MKNLRDMESRLAVFLRKEQLRLIVSRKYVRGEAEAETEAAANGQSTTTATSREVPNPDALLEAGVYKFEHLVTSREELEDTETSGEIRFDTSAMHVQGQRNPCNSPRRYASEPLILGVFRRKGPPARVTAMSRTRSSPAGLGNRESTRAITMKPKEYRCIVRYATTESSWGAPLECGELLSIVRHLREMNLTLNKLYRHWQRRLELLVQTQDQYIQSERDYLEWCILRILVELIEGISSQVTAFYVPYFQFQKFYRQPSFRRSATYSQITNRRLADFELLSHYVLSAYALKTVMDEYLEDVKSDFQRLQNLVNCRRLLKDFEASVRLSRHWGYAPPPWKCTKSEAEATVRSSCNDPLVIRAVRILPWPKLLKKTLLSHNLEEERRSELLKLRKKATEQEIKIQRQGKGRAKTQRALLKIKHSHAMSASDIEYKFWKRKLELDRRFEWKYYIRNFRGSKYQTGWVMSRARIDSVNKMFFANRKLALKLRLAWETSLSREELPYPLMNDYDHDCPPFTDDEPEPDLPLASDNVSCSNNNNNYFIL